METAAKKRNLILFIINYKSVCRSKIAQRLICSDIKFNKNNEVVIIWNITCWNVDCLKT